MEDDKTVDEDLAPDADEPGDDLPEKLAEFVTDVPDTPDNVDRPDPPDQESGS